MKKYSFFIVAVFAINLIALGCSAKDSTGNNATATKSIATGYGEKATTTTTTTTETKTASASTTTGPALFKSSNCTMCHKAPGVEGGGAMGPNLGGIGGKLTMAKLDDKFAPAGSHATRFKGSPAELTTLIKWLLSLK